MAGVVMLGGLDGVAERFILDAHAAGYSELQTANNFPAFRIVEGTDSDAAVEVFVVIGCRWCCR